MNGRLRLCMGALWLGSAACLPKPSGTCVARATPQLRTEDGTSLNLDDPYAVEAAAGRPVLVCAALREKRSGRVVDSRTGTGVGGAQVVVESWRASPPVVGYEWVLIDRVVARTFTASADGEFDISAEAAWLPGILAADGFPMIVQRTCVTAPGYAPFVREPSLAARAAELPARVELQRLAQGATAPPVACGP